MKYQIQWLSNEGWLDMGFSYETLVEALKGIRTYSLLFPMAEYQIKEIDLNGIDSN
jgi:hypothetical protein